MRALALWASGVLAFGAIGGCAGTFVGDSYSCSDRGADELQELPDGFHDAFPDYVFVADFDECDSGGGRGFRFRLKDPTKDGIGLLRSEGCEPVPGFDPEYPELACSFGDFHVIAEVEDPDVWVRPAAS